MVQPLQATVLPGHEFNWHSEPTLYSYPKLITGAWQNKLIHKIFIVEGFSEQALESIPEWNFNQQPPSSFQML